MCYNFPPGLPMSANETISCCHRILNPLCFFDGIQYQIQLRFVPIQYDDSKASLAA